MLKVGPVIVFCHSAIKILMNCVLCAEGNSIAIVLDIIVLGLNHQRNGGRVVL